jgi:predicted transcriptional regulator YdeE
MKFFLTIYICSVVTQNCAEVPVENHNYNRFYETHGECVQKGLGESYSILFDGKLFKIDTVNAMELYPKFMCEKTDNKEKPEA